MSFVPPALDFFHSGTPWSQFCGLFRVRSKLLSKDIDIRKDFNLLGYSGSNWGHSPDSFSCSFLHHLLPTHSFTFTLVLNGTHAQVKMFIVSRVQQNWLWYLIFILSFTMTMLMLLWMFYSWFNTQVRSVLTTSTNIQGISHRLSRTKRIGPGLICPIVHSISNGWILRRLMSCILGLSTVLISVILLGVLR